MLTKPVKFSMDAMAILFEMLLFTFLWNVSCSTNAVNVHTCSLKGGNALHCELNEAAVYEPDRLLSGVKFVTLQIKDQWKGNCTFKTRSLMPDLETLRVSDCIKIKIEAQPQVQVLCEKDNEDDEDDDGPPRGYITGGSVLSVLKEKRGKSCCSEISRYAEWMTVETGRAKIETEKLKKELELTEMKLQHEKELFELKKSVLKTKRDYYLKSK